LTPLWNNPVCRPFPNDF